MKKFQFAAATLIFTSAILVLTTASARASVPQAGEFVASECGAVLPTVPHTAGGVGWVDLTKSIGVKKVCIGLLAAAEQSPAALAVSFELADGEFQAFRVVQTSDDLVFFLNGMTQTTFYLATSDSDQSQVFPVHFLRGTDHQIVSAAGKFAELKFKTANFVPVMILQ